MASGTKEAPKQSLAQRLDAARQTAGTAKAVLVDLESRLQNAIQAEQYDDAHEIKALLPAADEDWAIAAAELQALETQVDALGRQRAQRDADEAAARRKQQAGKNLADAAQRERQGMENLAELKAEIVAGVGAVQDSISRAYLVEGQVRQARADVHQAHVDLGEASPGKEIVGPNLVSSYVERSQALIMIRRGQALPGVR